MPQMTLDVYYQKSPQKEEPTFNVPNDEKVELLRKLLRKILAKGKSEDSRDDRFPPYTLVGHVVSALERCRELERFVSSIKTIKYPLLANQGDRCVFFKNLAKAIIIHDLGKISLDFQRRLYASDKVPIDLWELLKESEGVKTYGNHEVFSLLLSFALLGKSSEDAMIRTAVLLHHYNEFFSQKEPKITKIIEGDNSNELKYLEFLLSKRDDLEALLRTYLGIIKKEFEKVEFIVEAADELINSMDFSRLETLKKQMETFGIDPSQEFPMYNPQEEQKTNVDFLVFLGMLRRCDYSSSGDFPIESVNSLDSTFNKVAEQIETYIRKKAGDSFKGLWQEELLKRHDSDYLAVIAPTGSGKTELAVLWARNRGKLVYTLPLRVALNDLYRRLAKEYFDEEHVGLLHSTAFMEYVEGAGTEIDIEKKVNSAGLLSMPVMLSTPDQVFLTGLNYYGSDKVISVYPESAIVVDEVQAYTLEMVAVFLKTLQLIKEAGGKVLIITATLPPHIRWFISGFTEDDSKKLGINIGELPKPLFNFKVVDVAEEFKGREEKVKNLTIKRHRIGVVDEALFEYQRDEETNKLEPVFNGKNCVLKKITEKFEPNGLRTVIMVVNNVKKAIKAYDELKNALGDKWVVKLLHSRLPEKKKQETIGEVKRLLEEHKKYRDAIKNGDMPDSKPNPILLITTQVVEASVDVDFDAMITEISPIDSQIQRWGRVYRNRKGDYALEIPNIVVFLGGDKIDKGTINVYGNGISKEIIKKTKEVLKNLDGKLLGYIEERDAIDEVYSGEILEDYIREINGLLKKLDYFTLEKKSEAQRVFRQMGGMYFVVPALMIEHGYSETVKKFGELLSDSKNFRLSWSDITQKLSQELEREVSKWELRKILQEFSVNIPIWFVLEDNNLQHALHNTFKGYPVVLTWDKDKAKILWTWGVDEVVKKDLDEPEDIL